MTQKNGLIIDEDGTRRWFVNGLRHREDGPAVEYADGDREWWVNGHPHRADGPAVEWADGGREWYVNGHLHREDGPAVERADGTCKWYLHGRELTFANWIRQLNCSERERLVYVLKYSHRESVT